MCIGNIRGNNKKTMYCTRTETTYKHDKEIVRFYTFNIYLDNKNLSPSQIVKYTRE